MKYETYIKVITLLLFTVSPVIAQESIQLSGKISAPYLETASIHIINSTQKTGTVNSDSGSFTLMVSENDELLFSSIQYKNTTVLITSEILKNGSLEVSLEEDLNVLEEVNISDISLTGSLTTDISNMEMVEMPRIDFNFGDIKNSAFESDINDPAKAPRNRAFESNEIMKSGVNFLALPGAIAAVLGIKEKPRVRIYKGQTKTSNDQLRQLFQEDFFINTLKVNKEYIDDFIFYADDHGLVSILKNQHDKLAIIEFLIEQSRGYLASKN